MRRLRITLAVAMLAGAFSMFGAITPERVFACSCIPPRPIAEYAAEPDTLILAGTVTAVGKDLRGMFRVERWYKGSSDVVDVPIQGGNGADCGIGLSVGQQLVMVAYASDGILHPNICSPWGDLSTPEGQQLADEALLAYGEGTVPGGAEPGGTPPDTFSVPWIVVIGGAAIVLIIAIAAGASFVAGRRNG